MIFAGLLALTPKGIREIIKTADVIKDFERKEGRIPTARELEELKVPEVSGFAIKEVKK